MNSPVNRLALHALHEQLGAKMAGFAGYEMPIQYAQGVKAEHLWVRGHAGLFDVSHMGQLRVTGPSLFESLQLALPVDFSDWPVGVQRYSLLLNDAAGIEDDLMVTLEALEPEPVVRIVVNAGNRDKDLALLQSRCPSLRFEWIDAALIALQGPAAGALIASLDPTADAMRFMSAGPLKLFDVNCYASRSGYTGEDGFEISVPSQEAFKVVSQLLGDPSVKAIGLGARDSLRMEAGLPLHGNDIDAGISPVMAGLMFGVAPSRRKPDGQPFVGKAALLEQIANPPAKKLLAFVSPQNAPIRAHCLLENEAGQVIGEVSSGTLSPSLGQPILLALVDGPAVATAPSLVARVRDRLLPVTLAKLPFVAKRYRR
jgi:aminomethyltransferase